MTAEEVKLKPCPFCGSTKMARSTIEPGDVYCLCTHSLFREKEWNDAFCWKEIERLKEPLRLDEYKGLLFEKDVRIKSLETLCAEMREMLLVFHVCGHGRTKVCDPCDLVDKAAAILGKGSKDEPLNDPYGGSRGAL